MNWAQGVKRFFITDDNFARNKDWEAIYDRIIKLREEDGMDVRFMIQVDTLCHRIPNFIEKSRRAGVTRVFIGLENINPANLIAAKKRQNKITEYRKMLLEWKRYGIMTFAGYILGFPNDTPESIRHDLDIIKKELPLDMLEFFVLTPLPGSEDHKVLAEKGVWMDPDMNKYELEHVVTAHAKMSKDEWQEAYRTAWGIFYTEEHLETVLRRAYACGINIRSLMPVLFWFSSAVPVENLHPLQWGIFRIKRRTDRRSGLPLESPIPFYARYAAEMSRKALALAKRWRMLKAIVRKIEADPNAKALYGRGADAGGGGRFRAYGDLHAERGGAHRGRARAPRGGQARPPASRACRQRQWADRQWARGQWASTTTTTPTSTKSPAPRRPLRPNRSATYRLPKARLMIPAKPESLPLRAIRCGRLRRKPNKPRCSGSAAATTVSLSGRAAAASLRGGRRFLAATTTALAAGAGGATACGTTAGGAATCSGREAGAAEATTCG